MLDGMRKNARSWVIKLIFGVIILVFVFWGVGSFRINKKSVLAKVNGEPILSRDFFKTYQQEYERLLKQRPDLSGEDLKNLGLKKLVFNEMVNQLILTQEADKLGIVVSTEELRKKITSMDAFKNKDKVFDPQRYKMVLSANNLTPMEFETLVKKDLRIKKLKELITSSISVTDREVKDLYEFIMREAKLKYVLFDPKNYRDKVKLNDKEIKEYYKEHKNDFKEPEKIQIQYIKITPDTISPLIKVSEEEIKKYYTENKSKFFVPEERKVAHILIKIAKDDKDGKKAKKKIMDILKKIKKGADFAKMAKKYSEGPSAKNGGDIGWIKKGETVKKFEELAFSLKKGEVGGPIKTIFGYHIIKVEDIRAAHYKSLEEAKDEIRNTIAREKAMDKIEEFLDKTLDIVFNSNDLKKAAHKVGLEVVTSKLLSKKDIKDTFNIKDQDVEQLFLMENNKIYDTPIIIKNGYLIVKKIKDVPARIKKLDEVKDEIVDILKTQKARLIAKKEAEKVLKDIKDHKKDKELSFKETDYFKVSQRFIPSLGINGLLSKDILFAKKGMWLDNVYEINGGYIIAQVIDMRKPKKDEWEKQKGFWEKMALERKKGALFKNFLRGLRKKAKIEVLNPDLLQG